MALARRPWAQSEAEAAAYGRRRGDDIPGRRGRLLGASPGLGPSQCRVLSPQKYPPGRRVVFTSRVTRLPRPRPSLRLELRDSASSCSESDDSEISDERQVYNVMVQMIKM